MLKGYTFKVVLLDTNDEVKLSRIFAAKNAYEAALMLADWLKERGVVDDYQLFCNEEEI